MSFRARLLLAFFAVVFIPMLLFAVAVRNEVGERLSAQYERRVAALVEVFEEDLAQESEAIAASLSGLADALIDDNRFRRAAVGGAESERRYLLDYAGNAMRLTGLSMLQIQTANGRIISSGHFRNEYDRLEPELARLLAAAPDGMGLVQARTPESTFLALARVDSLRMAGRLFTIVGGVSVERRFLARLARESGLTLSLVYPGGALTSGDPQAQEGEGVELTVPLIDAAADRSEEASIRVTHSQAELAELRRSIDQWFFIAAAATVLIALLLANWLASRFSRPIMDLADKTSRVDLDRLGVDFTSKRRDEIGALSRLLGAMTDRLRAGAAKIKEAERRATVGELARQVNHDIKNGLTPIRNVFRHLMTVSRDDPGQLPDVFDERKGTIDSSIDYLETLASNYARLYPRFDRQPCDVHAVVREVVTNAGASSQVDLRLDLAPGPAVVIGDAVVLRRIFENLVDNAVDSLASKAGAVSVSTGLVSNEAQESRVRVTVADTGSGMTREQLDKIFDDFYTTKADGTGLGLSIVRRLVMDLNGSVSVESEVGKGSRVIVDLPAGAEPGRSG
jgi:signal transduction histidine kinase